MNENRKKRLRKASKQLDRQNVFICSNGKAKPWEPCAVCGRVKYPWEDEFPIYGKPICEDCFWEDDFPDNIPE